MSVVIQVEHLSKQYGDMKAVDDLSFTVNAGDIYGFLGQNGAGKSTTIRMLLTLIRPTAGKIEMFGMNLNSHRKEILRQVGAVIERPDLYKYLTAYENLALFARISGVKPTRSLLEAQLEQVGLISRANSKVHTFSQGMKQRLGIAVALVHNPQLIILDEPTNGLDPQGIADIRNLVLDLSRKQGKTVLVSSHLLNEIEMVANRMIIIDKGKKMVEGNVEHLFDSKKMLVSLQLNNPEVILSKLAQSFWQSFVKEHQQQTIVFQLDKQLLPRLTSDLVGMGAEIIALQPQHSLEAYFLSLTTANRHVDTFTN
ncbi:MAG: ABC transporter ATP-binding protein [Chitinophagaceae bacterium]